MNAKDYLGDIIGGGLMPREAKLIAELILRKPCEAEWNQQLVSENLLQKGSVHSAKRFASTLRKRLEPLGPEFCRALLAADESHARQLLLLSVMLNSPIMADFMTTVLGSAARLYRESLSSNDWQEFIAARSRAIPELSDYSDSSLQKIGNNILKILADVGYLDSARRKTLQRIYILPEIRDWVNRMARTDLIPALEARA